MDWREEYKRKLLTPEQAAKMVKSGDTVALGGSTDQPKIMQAALFARRNELQDVNIVIACPGSDPGWLTPGVEDSFKVTIPVFIGTVARLATRDRLAEYIPHSFATNAIAFDRPGEEKNFDVYIVTVSPPNKNGYCCFGPLLFFKRTWMGRARKIIAEVDANMKWVYGDTMAHVSEIDHFVEYTPPTMEEADVAAVVKDLDSAKQEKILCYARLLQPYQRPSYVSAWSKMDLSAIDSAAETLGLVVPREAEKAFKAIAGYVSTLIKSGDCLQLGMGTPSSFLYRLGAFTGKEDLAYHAELSPVGVGTMVKEGQITGRRKNFMPGKTILSASGGMSPDELEYAAENPKFEFYSTAWVTRPDVICQNDNMVALQNALSVDLTGQINSESIFGGIPVNGPGGQPESHLGALFSKGGRGITLLRSTAMGGAVSCIVSQLELGSVVTIPRYQADHIVTEYGIARLMGKTLKERANELIAVAHPDFRAELKKEAQKLF